MSSYQPPRPMGRPPPPQPGRRRNGSSPLPILLIAVGGIAALTLVVVLLIVVVRAVTPAPTPTPEPPTATPLAPIATLPPPPTGLAVHPSLEKTCFTIEPTWVRNQPIADSIGVRQTGKTEAVEVTGEAGDWYQIKFNNGLAYVEKAKVNCP